MFCGFTVKELKVIALGVEGHKARYIAEAMGIKITSVYDLLRSIYRKSGTHSLAEMVLWAKENALDAPIEPETDRPVPGIPAKLERRNRYHWYPGWGRRAGKRVGIFRIKDLMDKINLPAR